MKTIAFIVSGSHDSAMGFRARDLASRVAGYDIRIGYRSQRTFGSILRLFIFLLRVRPAVSYVFDISYTAILSAGFYRIVFRNLLIVETGDAIVELVRSTGSRGKLRIWLTGLLEKTAFRVADRVVVRGSFHQEWLSRRGIRADVIQDGVDTRRFTPGDSADLRKQYGVNGHLTVGLLGSSIWSEKLQMCYGWELIETIQLLKERHVKGIMIGSGTGIPHLKARCREYGIEDRMVFLDHVPYDQLPPFLNLIDVCLSTQTNDLVGQVRTTGKLPLYLAAGRYILATNVGEAARVLDKEMLVDYEGVKDEQYPHKLAGRIKSVLECPEILNRAARNPTVAKAHFDYSILSKRLEQCLDEILRVGRNHR